MSSERLPEPDRRSMPARRRGCRPGCGHGRSPTSRPEPAPSDGADSCRPADAPGPTEPAECRAVRRRRKTVRAPSAAARPRLPVARPPCPSACARGPQAEPTATIAATASPPTTAAPAAAAPRRPPPPRRPSEDRYEIGASDSASAPASSASAGWTTATGRPPVARLCAVPCRDGRRCRRPSRSPWPRRSSGRRDDGRDHARLRRAVPSSPVTEVCRAAGLAEHRLGEKRCSTAGASRPAAQSSTTSPRTVSSTWSRRCRSAASLWDAWDDPDATPPSKLRLAEADGRGAARACTSAGRHPRRRCGPTWSWSTTRRPGARSTTCPTCCRCRCRADAPFAAPCTRPRNWSPARQGRRPRRPVQLRRHALLAARRPRTEREGLRAARQAQAVHPAFPDVHPAFGRLIMQDLPQRPRTSASRPTRPARRTRPASPS